MQNAKCRSVLNGRKLWTQSRQAADNLNKPTADGRKAESGFHRTPLEIPNRLITTATAGPAVFATTTAAAAVFTTTAAAGGRSFFTRLGNIYGEGASAHILAIQGIRGLLRFLVGAHGHETKAAGTIGHAIHDEAGVRDRAMRGEGVSQVIFSGVEGKVPDK